MSEEQEVEPQAPPPPPPPAPHPGLRLAALTLYLPLIAALAYLIVLCGLILAHGKKAGLYGLPYAGVLAVVLRRYARVFRDEAGPVWKDLVALVIADSLLLIVWLERFVL
jgi:hypothetical protein